MVIGSGPQGKCDLVRPGQAKRRNNNQVLAVKCIQKLGGLVGGKSLLGLEPRCFLPV